MIEIGSRRSVTASPASDAFGVKLINGGRVDVGGRGNSADAAVPHVGEQERFAADKNIETGPSRTGSSERVEEHLRIIPIARAIFHPGDRARIRRKEALDQSPGDCDYRAGRNV